jgi:DNA-binding beta-propeller fold protein YncE
MKNLLRISFNLTFAALSLATVCAQQAKTASEKAADEGPKYPRTNLAPWYGVDPTWPQRPAGVHFGHVPGIAVDKQDNVWIFTRTNNPVQVYTAAGKFVRAWGDGVVSNAHHLKIDQAGNIWLSDIGLHVVRKFTPEGKLLQTFGVPGEKGEDTKRLNMPTDMALAPNGDVFISDGYGNNRVVHFDKSGKFIRSWGTLGTGAQNFSIPHAIDIDSKGRLYVADRNNVRVQVFNATGKLLDSWANIVVPWGFWISAKDEIWVCGSSPMPWRNDAKYPTAPLSCPPKDQLFMKFDPNGKVTQLWTVPKGEDDKEQPGDLNWLHCLALDSKGNIYAGDIIGKRAQKFVRRN